MKIPFTKYRIKKLYFKNGSSCNGNGWEAWNFGIQIKKILGTGDDGTRGLREPHGRINS